MEHVEVVVDPQYLLDAFVRRQAILEDVLLTELGQLQFPFLQFLSGASAVKIQCLENMLPGNKHSL